MSMSLPSSKKTLRVAGAAIPQRLGKPPPHPVHLSGTQEIDSLFAGELLLQTPDAPA